MASTTATKAKCIAGPIFCFASAAGPGKEVQHHRMCESHVFPEDPQYTFRGHQLAAVFSVDVVNSAGVAVQWFFHGFFRILLEFSKHRNLDGFGWYGAATAEEFRMPDALIML